VACLHAVGACHSRCDQQRASGSSCGDRTARAWRPRISGAESEIRYQPRRSPRGRAWEDLSCWVETNVFLSAKREGWLGALRHFSAMSLRSMKAWSQWERMDAVWRCSAPRQLTYASGVGPHGSRGDSTLKSW
jgi:hypothetical protein